MVFALFFCAKFGKVQPTVQIHTNIARRPKGVYSQCGERIRLAWLWCFTILWRDLFKRCCWSSLITDGLYHCTSAYDVCVCYLFKQMRCLLVVLRWLLFWASTKRRANQKALHTIIYILLMCIRVYQSSNERAIVIIIGFIKLLTHTYLPVCMWMC